VVIGRTTLRRFLIGLTGAVALGMLTVGCGASPGTSDDPGAGKTVAPPPRPGEDTMKDAMLKLKQKGALPKGLVIPKNP
jgi:hypothetical protein